MKKSFKKVVAFLLVLGMCINMPEVRAYAEENVIVESGVTGVLQSGWDGVTTESSYVGENFNVTFSLASYWEGGYNANVKIENTGETSIENWYLSFALDNVLTNVWNAELTSNEPGQYVVKNAGWNADIPVGGSVEFGLSANENFKGFPYRYSLLVENTQVQEEDYSIKYILDSDWGAGFTGRVEVTNNTENTLEDWTLEFDFNRNITNIWNSVIESQEDNHYVIKNAGYNANIAAGQTISFGFNGEGGEATEEPCNYTLNSYVQGNTAGDEEDTEIDESMDTDDDLLVDFLEDYYGTDKEKPDTDGDGLTDYEEVQLGLNPKDIFTNGVLDAEYETKQVVSGDQVDINRIEANYECTVSLNGVGLASERLSVIPTMNVNLIDSEFILGNTIDIDYVGNYNNALISFKIDEVNIDNSDSQYAKSTDELKGIKRFQIFKLDTEKAGLYPIETMHDVETNTISADVDDFGTFCVIDLEKWLDSLDIAPDKTEPEENIVSEDFSLFSLASFDEDVTEVTSDELVSRLANNSGGSVITAPTYYLDIVYLVNNSQMVDVEATKEKLESLTKMLYNQKNYNVRVGVTTYCCYLCSRTKGLITYKK